jgi:molybdopterin molybdotransferase
MDGWYPQIKVAEVLFEDAEAFRNINTRDELQAGWIPARPPKLAEVVSCLSGYDPDALPVRDAQKIIREFVTPVRATEQVALRAALGRVLARTSSRRSTCRPTTIRRWMAMRCAARICRLRPTCACA